MSTAPKRIRGWDEDSGSFFRQLTQWRQVDDETLEELRTIAGETFLDCENSKGFREGLNVAAWFYNAVGQETERRQETDRDATEPEAFLCPRFEADEALSFLTILDVNLRCSVVNSLADEMLSQLQRVLICQALARVRGS